LDELSNQLGEYELGTGTTVSAFYYHLYITMIRVQHNHFVTVPEWLRTIDYQEKDFQLLYSLQDRINQAFGIYLPKEEFAWIHLSIIAKRTIDRSDQEIRFVQRFNCWAGIEQAVSAYLSDPFFEQWDTELLGYFMTSFFVSRLMNDALSPLLNKELREVHDMVEKKHSQIHKINTHFLATHSQILPFSSQTFEDVAVSFTLYMDMVFRYYQPVKQILFLLEGDYLVVQSIRIEAREQLGDHHQLLFIKLQEVTPEQLNSTQIDLIVTNYRPYLSDYIFETEYVLINSQPTQKDWAMIKHQLNPLTDQLSF
ncbi:PRD domain-containing protein, partial [Enterococcus casseliflavus]|uniref:PRD domain-containing protein n=1 Tax=Enterococcus casseliflavus TaxID=37734 RepID=UPI00119DDFC9